MFEKSAIAIVPELYTTESWGLFSHRPAPRPVFEPARSPKTRRARRWLARIGLGAAAAATGALVVTAPPPPPDRGAETASYECMATACSPRLALDQSIRVLEAASQQASEARPAATGATIACATSASCAIGASATATNG